MNISKNQDEALFAILKDCKTLPNFLDNIFGFLYRNTDFYQIATDPSCPVGLPEGLAERTVVQTFNRWKICEITPEILPVAPKAVLPKPKPQANQFTTAESYNGATFDNYSWSQNLLEIDINVKIPESITAKDLKVQIQSGHISVKLKDSTVLLEGEFCDKCKQNEAIWSLHKNKLEIHLDKARELWWNCLIKTEPKLDISKLDCSRPYEELPEEAQAKIEELQWNQDRKRKELGNTQEMAMLQQSWNAEGSPFSGPFDPSAVKFS